MQLVSQGPSFAGCLRSLDESWRRAGLPRTLLGCADPAAEAEPVWQVPLQASQAHHWLQVACLEAMAPALAFFEPWLPSEIKDTTLLRRSAWSGA